MLKIVSFLISSAVMYYFFLQPMQVVGLNPIEPFKNGQQLFSERVSYLFIEPKVGDAVVFRTSANNMSNFGIITKKDTQSNIKTYQIISTKTQQKPWEVSEGEIIARIYYPVVTKSSK